MLLRLGPIGASGAGPKGRHHQLLTGQLDPIARLQLAAAPLFQLAIDAHIALLDPEFGLAARAHQALPFEELIETQLARRIQGRRIRRQRLAALGLRRGRFQGAGCCRVGVPVALPVRAWGGGEGQNNADSLP